MLFLNAIAIGTHMRCRVHAHGIPAGYCPVSAPPPPLLSLLLPIVAVISWSHCQAPGCCALGPCDVWQGTARSAQKKSKEEEGWIQADMLG
ncbi:hypothetical protein GQ54DRAFT_559 [Martensiomyces pterosporus]|nr:hypothetical protein GQ54DRAFT_559 [Martensiomyces pterosporus]